MKQSTIERTETDTQTADALTVRITVGANRRSQQWRGADMTWRELAKRFHEPTRLAETVEEVARVPKDERMTLKDRGGFLGGVLAGERRKKAAVSWRTLITLDADFATAGFIDRVREVVPCAWLVHSTFSHSEKSPRYRLIIPPARPLKLDEFAFISRRLAADIGVE